jgi:structural maintenance of chromosome 1
VTGRSSLDLAPQYELAKTAQEKATEASTANYAKKRGMLNDVRHLKEQRDEVRQWERMREAKASLHFRLLDGADVAIRTK